MLNTGMGMKKGKEHNKRVSVYVEGVFVKQKWKMKAKQDGSKVSKNDLLLLLKIFKKHFKMLPQFQKLSN